MFTQLVKANKKGTKWSLLVRIELQIFSRDIHFPVEMDKILRHSGILIPPGRIKKKMLESKKLKNLIKNLFAEMFFNFFQRKEKEKENIFFPFGYFSGTFRVLSGAVSSPSHKRIVTIGWSKMIIFSIVFVNDPLW